MKIFYVASEASPFVKTGGLADVAGSLPQALVRKGQEVSVVLPLYGQIKKEFRQEMEYLGQFYVELGLIDRYCGVMHSQRDGVDYYFLDNEYYFNRTSLYGQDDDGERFAFFSKAAVQLLKFLDVSPEIVHANDWHTGLVPLYIKDFARGDSFYSPIKSVYTIHNIKYQGVFPADGMYRVLSLSPEYYNDESFLYYDSVNYMKAGIVYCDLLTTVSETYAQEITYSYFGEGLDGIIRKHQRKLVGIINGLDTENFNPKNDPHISQNYSVDSLDAKVDNKLALQKFLSLEVNPDIPMLGIVSRLVDLKGIDLIEYVLPEILHLGVQVVVLGTGEKKYEDMFRFYQRIFPEKLRAEIYFNEAMSREVYAASDIYLMPSVAEPCGISQMISMAYGSLPVVRQTGGLADTVHYYGYDSDESNGFVFSNINAHEFLFTTQKAVEMYNEKKDQWRKLQINAMSQDLSWDASSEKYIDHYKIISDRRYGN